MVCSMSLRRLLCCFGHVLQTPGTSSSPKSTPLPQDSIEVNLFDSIPLPRDSIEVNLFDSIPLPQDILVEILLLLPFKAILDCKLVSKQWNNLINDPKFSNAYTKNYSTSLSLSKNNLYFLRIRQGKEKKDRNPPFTFHRIPIDSKIDNIRPFYYYRVWGLSNGVACVKSNYGQFFVYNLFTGASHTVTRVPEESMYSQWACYGFGYDRYADDHSISGVSKLGKFWVYNPRNKGWKSLEGFPYHAYDWTSRERNRASSISGVLHWLVFTKEYTKEVIFTYDLHTRRFGEILVPLASGRDETGLATSISELNGQLCYLYQKWYDTSNIVKFDVWAMKKYGILDSWEKFVSINCCSSTIGILSNGCTPTLLQESGDGGKVVTLAYYTTSMLVWYNVEENKVEKLYMTENDWEE